MRPNKDPSPNEEMDMGRGRISFGILLYYVFEIIIKNTHE